MKYLVAGLGNVGDEYRNTRHNIGFDILDSLAGVQGLVFDDKRYGFITEYRYKGRILYLLKPSTYVNLSGRAILYWLKKKSVPFENLLVLVDDIALPLGKLKLKPAGGDGGHNGLRNIIDVLGDQNFARLRFGIGSDFPFGNQVDFVLSRWTPEERILVEQKIPVCIEIIRSFVTAGQEITMNIYNNK